MRICKIISYLLSLWILSACSATSDFHIPFIATSADQQMAPIKDGTNNERVYGEHCRSLSTLPFFWRVNMDKALEKALSKRQGIIALEDVQVTHKVQFYLVYSTICTEIVGQPLYAKNEFD